MDTDQPAKSGHAGKLAATGPENAGVPIYTQQVEDISQELMGYIADKWTLVVLEALRSDVMRFSELRKVIPGISQKMLTQTLRQMERNGLITRKVHAVVPPKVEYQCTDLARSLGPVICGLWTWVETNASALVAARARFDAATKENQSDDTGQNGVESA